MKQRPESTKPFTDDAHAFVVMRAEEAPMDSHFWPVAKNRQAIEDAHAVAKRILNVLRSHFNAGLDLSCGASCVHCNQHHLPKIVSAIMASKVIEFVLPAFPGKSPNLAKVLGAGADFAEWAALKSIGAFFEKVQDVYAPGARMILCSDGRVFSDAVGMREDDVTLYQKKMWSMIQDLELHELSFFNLDDCYPGDDFLAMRQKLMERYGTDFEAFRKKVKRGGQSDASAEDREAHRLYCGITRFLFEDAHFPGQTMSRTAIQRDSRKRAYTVVQRSNAWSRLISEKFPQAVRLSIHPQLCGSKKIGIRLLSGDRWMTPWHGVAVRVQEQVVLKKRWEAEEMGAVLNYFENGDPSHFEYLDNEAHDSKVQDEI